MSQACAQYRISCSEHTLTRTLMRERSSGLAHSRLGSGVANVCRPVVLSTSQARRIAELQQWQLRRVVRVPDGASVEGWVRDEQGELRAIVVRGEQRPLMTGCPFGGVDDWLWVRERWHVDGAGPKRRIVYEAASSASSSARSWLSPMLLPRSAARLWLRVYNVRCQRLQDATAIDYAAEGIACPVHDTEYSHCMAECPARRAALARAWDSSHDPPQQWAANPWVWAISITRFDAAGAARAMQTDRAASSAPPLGARRPRRNAQPRRAAARKA
jgi:hypothetical protein